MHHIHHTRGFIIDSCARGVADRTLYVFTEELGLVIAIARSVREVRSKLRPHAQDFTAGSFSFVRGKSGWHLTGAEGNKNLSYIFAVGSARFSLVARVFALLRRIVSGEDPNGKLYSILSSAIEALEGFQEKSEILDVFEMILVLRLLHSLGYIGEGKRISEFYKEPEEWQRYMKKAGEHREELLMHINRAIRESHL